MILLFCSTQDQDQNEKERKEKEKIDSFFIQN